VIVGSALVRAGRDDASALAKLVTALRAATRSDADATA
jgi:hypothetical protein